MPQFDFSTYIPQIFWSMIAFSVLYVFITFWFIPKVGNAVLSRRKYISDIDNKVKNMRSEIDKLSKEYELRLDEVVKQCSDYKDSEILKQKKYFEEKHNNQILKFNLKIKSQENEFNMQLKKMKDELDKNLSVIISSIVSRYNLDVSEEEVKKYIKEAK